MFSRTLNLSGTSPDKADPAGLITIQPRAISAMRNHAYGNRSTISIKTKMINDGNNILTTAIKNRLHNTSTKEQISEIITKRIKEFKKLVEMH